MQVFHVGHRKLSPKGGSHLLTFGVPLLTITYISLLFRILKAATNHSFLSFSFFPFLLPLFSIRP